MQSVRIPHFLIALGSLLFSVSLGTGCTGQTPPPMEDPLDVLLVDRAPVDRVTPAQRSPYPVSDYTLVLPFNGPEQTIDARFEAGPGLVDVHLLIDTTASFDGEIDDLQASLDGFVIPGLQRRVGSLSLGVSRFEDMPFAPFGSPTDRPFTLLVPQTNNSSAVLRAVQRLDDPLGEGGDLPEAYFEALYQIATGAGLINPGRTLVEPFQGASQGGGNLGGVGFRANSTRVVVLATDATAHEGFEYSGVVQTPHGSMAAIEALRTLSVKVVGISSGNAARATLENLATQTGALAPSFGGQCATGLGGAARAPVNGMCPLVYDISPDGQGLSQSIVDGINTLLSTIAFSAVHGEVRDDGRNFVSSIEAVSAQAPMGTMAPARVDQIPAGAPDGVLDTFTQVRTGTALSFRAHLRNRSVRETEFPQVFFLRIALVGDGATLRESTIRVIVPEGPKFDGGLDDASMSDAVVPSDVPVLDASDAVSDAGAMDVSAPLDVGETE